LLLGQLFFRPVAVPDLDPEFINTSAFWSVTINDRQKVLVTGFVVDFAVALKLSSGSGKCPVIIIRGTEFKVPKNEVD